MILVGERLKALRLSKKMSQKDLAEKLKIAKSVISFYESDARCPSYEVLIKIAETFNVTTDYLLGVDDKRMIDVSSLSEEDVAAVTTVIDALKRKSNG